MSKFFGKSIVFVTDVAGFVGGIERYVNQTAKWLLSQGAHLSLIYQNPGRNFDLFIQPFEKIYTQVNELKCDLVIVHKLESASRLKEIYQKFGCQRVTVVVHDHDFYCPRSYFYTPLGRKNCSKPYAWLRCGICGMARHPNKWKNGLICEVKKQFIAFPERIELLKKAGLFIVLSKFMKENLIRNGFAKNRIKILHPFIELPENEKNETTPPTIGFVGQLIKGKGADTFLYMLAKLKNPYQALVIGDGNEREYLEHLAVELGVAVKFTGFTTEPEAYLSKISVMALPFRWQEPFGLVGLEAAARGIPVVAYNTGGVAQWLHQEKNGIAVLPGDIDKFTHNVDNLLSNIDIRNEMANYGRNLAKNEFSSEVFKEGMENIICQIKCLNEKELL